MYYIFLTRKAISVSVLALSRVVSVLALSCVVVCGHVRGSLQLMSVMPPAPEG